MIVLVAPVLRVKVRMSFPTEISTFSRSGESDMPEGFIENEMSFGILACGSASRNPSASFP